MWVLELKIIKHSHCTGGGFIIVHTISMQQNETIIIQHAFTKITTKKKSQHALSFLSLVCCLYGI